MLMAEKENKYIQLIRSVIEDVVLMENDKNKVDIKITSSSKSVIIEVITDDVNIRARLIGRNGKNAIMLRNLARLISAKINKQVMIYVE